MAEYDGAVRVNTAFDAQGFDKGVDRMTKAMSSLSDKIEKLGQTIDRSFRGYVKTLTDAGAAMRPIETATENAADKTEQLGGAADKAAESYSRVAQEADKAKAALSGMGDAGNLDALSGMFDDFKRQISELESAYQGMLSSGGEIDAAQLSDFGAQLDSLYNDYDALNDVSADYWTSDVLDSLDEMSGRLKELDADFRRVSESATQTSAPVEQIPEPIEEAEQGAQSLESDFEGVSKQIKNVWAEARTAARLVGELQKNADGGVLEKDFDAASKAVETLRASASRLPETLQSVSGEDGFQRLSMSAERLNGWVEKIASDFEELGNVKLISPTFLTDDIKAAETALSEYQDRVSDMSGEEAQYSEWLDIAAEIADAAAEAGELQAALDALSESGDIDETQYDELSARIADLIGDYDDLQDAVDVSTQDAKPQYLKDWEQMPTLSGMVSDGFERIRNSALTALTAVQHPVQALDRGLALVAQTAIRAGAALLQMARSSIINGLRLIGQSAAEAARNITRMTATAVSGGIKRLGAWLSSAAKSMTLFGRSTKRNNDVLKKSLTTILKYGLGVRSFYFLFRKVRQAIAEGYRNLARYSGTLNQSISGVISSFKRFENQFAASFEPLVNIVAPAITRMIDGLTEATFRAGEFIAALSGQKTVIRAKEVQEDYAASLDKTKKAAKDAERQLAGFDQLNILKAPDEEEASPEDMFETVPVEDEAKDFADAVKEAWVNVDLSDIGGTIGGKLKIALDNIPWPDIQQGAEDTGKRLATFLNGLIKVPDLGKSLGKSIAEAINAAFSFLDGFAWNFDWKGLGNAIMDTVEAACDNLDWERINHALQGLAIGLADLLNTIFSRKEVWEKVGRTIGKGLNAAVNAGITFLERFDFNQAASAIVAGLNAAIDEIEWDKIGRLLADAFGGALQFLRTAALEFDWVALGTSFAEGLNEFVRVMLDKILHFEWEEIGKGIADGLNAAVSGIGWNSFGTLVGRLIGGALKIAASFIRELDYGEIMKSIEEFLSSALRRIDYYDLLTVWGVAALIVAVKKIIATHPVLALLVGAILALGPELGNAIHKMVSDIPWQEYGREQAEQFNWLINRIDEAITSVDWAGETAAIMVGLNSFLAGIEWDTLGQTLTDMVMAFLTVINTALYDFDWKGLGADIAVLIQNIDVVEILKGAARLASNIVAGLFELINGFLETADWTELPGTILNGFLGVVTSVEWGRIAGQIIELLLNAILVVIQLAWGIGEAIAEWILNGIEAAKNYFQEAGENVANGILEGLGKIWDGIKGWIKEHIFQPFISAWEHIWQIGSPSKVMEEQGGFIISGLFNGISAAWHLITDFFGGALDGLITTLGGAWDAIGGAASTAWNGISTTLSGVWETVRTAAGDKFGEVASTVAGAWGTISKDADGALKGIVKDVSGKWNDIKTDASAAWGDIQKELPRKAEEAKTGVLSKVRELATQALPFWRQSHTDAQREWKQTETSVVQSANTASNQALAAFRSLQGSLPGVWGSIRSAASGALSSVTGAVKSMVDSVSSRLSSIQTSVRNVTSTTSDALAKTANQMDALAKKNANNAAKVSGLASGGVVTNSGHIRSWYDSVRKYASGTSRATGSLFVAGEAGPEIVGHVNGRTEVLNESQIAGAIYGAVLAAMSEAVKTFGGFLSQQMASNTNALITAIGQIRAPAQIAAPQDTALIERLAALQTVPYQVPAYATGTVMPYEVVAEIRRQTSEITAAIYSEGEDIIQAVISAISNHGLALADAIRKIPVNRGQNYSQDDMAQYTIDEINRRARMNGRSPLLS